MLDEVCARQAGAITRVQARAAGLTDEAIEARLHGGRWQRVFGRVYATFSGPVPRGCLLWAAVLRAGEGATLSHETAAELVGLLDGPSARIHLTVPAGRRIAPVPGVQLHRSRLVHVTRHGSRLPPQTRVEDTVLDLTQSATDLDTALSWCARACGRRLTTPARLPVALDARRRVRWRAELSAVLQDVGDGCHSLLELKYLRDVERRHGLPRARRQAATERPDGGRGYADVSYDELGVLVELDGRVAHPEHARWRDMERDNAAAITGAAVLRYGWADVAQRPCAVAAEVAAMLQTAGWSGTLRRCGSTCG